jgi:hypothetical protein
MVSEGGAMEGYCSIGSCPSASNPASAMPSAITQAKTGLSMKKRGITREASAGGTAYGRS